jgi:membrane peptidoglycan carboxypeptidase
MEKKHVLSARTAEIFKDILKSVVEEGGTGQGASVNGNEVAGKTGTAQMINPLTKRYSKEKYVSSFVGFVPADDPKLAIIVVVYEPKGQIYGSVVAAPARDIADGHYRTDIHGKIYHSGMHCWYAMMLKQLLNGCGCLNAPGASLLCGLGHIRGFMIREC